MGVFARKCGKKNDGDEDKNGETKKKKSFLGRSKRTSVGVSGQKDAKQSNVDKSTKKLQSWLKKNLDQLENSENTIEAAKICWRLTRAMECSDKRNVENEGNILLQVLGLTSFVAGLVLPLVGVPMVGVPDVLGFNSTAAQVYDTIDLLKGAEDAVKTTSSMTTPLLSRGRSYTREQVVEAGGVTALITALRRHIKDPVATAAILRTLWEVNRFTIPWELIRLKMSFSGCDQSAAVASYYSEVWVESVKKNFNTLINNGGHLLILEAIKLHMGKENASTSAAAAYEGNGIPDLACCILGTIIELECNIQQELMHNGAASTIIEAMQEEKENVWLASGGLAILRTLLSSTENHDAFCRDTSSIRFIQIALQSLTLSQQDPKGDDRLAFALSRLAEDACIFLSVLAFGDKNNTARIGRMGGIKQILDTMRHFNKNMATQNFGFLALISLSLNAVNQEDIGMHGGIVVAMDNLKNLTESSDDTKSAVSSKGSGNFYLNFMEYNSTCFYDKLPLKVCDALYMFIRGSKANADQLMHKKDGIDILMNTVKHFSKSSEIQKTILTILDDLLDHGSLICGGESDVPKINIYSVKKVLGIILWSLQNNPGEAGVQQKGFTGLRKIAENYQMAKIISNVGGINIILDAMLRHPDDLEIQELGCLVMEKLSNNPNTHAAILEKKSKIEEIASALLKQSDGISRGGGRLLKALCPMIEAQNADLIAKELSQNPKYIALFLDGLPKQPICTLHTGLKVIKLLTTNSKNAEVISKKGGVVIVANAMLHHPENVEVQVQGYAALANLALTGNKYGTIRKLNKMIGMLLCRLRNYPEEEGLQREGCRLLRNIVTNPESKESIIKEGGIPVIINAISNHPDTEETQAMGCSTLSALAANHSSHPAIKEMDLGVGTILDSVKNHPHMVCMQIAGCRFIRNMAVDFQSTELMCREGAVGVVLHAMLRYSENIEVQVQCCAAISNMAATNEAARGAIVAHNGCKLIMSAMKKFPRESVIQEQGCRALDGLGDIVFNEHARVVEVVREARQHNPNSIIIQQRGSRIMRRLSEGSKVKASAVAR